MPQTGTSLSVIEDIPDLNASGPRRRKRGGLKEQAEMPWTRMPLVPDGGRGQADGVSGGAPDWNANGLRWRKRIRQREQSEVPRTGMLLRV